MFKRLLTSAAIGALCIASAHATPGDEGNPMWTFTVDPTTNPPTILGTASNPMHISGSFSASFAGFTPTPSYSQLAVGLTSTRVALPTGTVVIVYNTGASPAFVTLGSTAVVATATDDVIQPGSWLAFTVGGNVDLAAITSTGSASLNISGGAGFPSGAGGGSSGGGGGTATTPFVPSATSIAPFTATSTNTQTSIPAGATALIVNNAGSTTSVLHCTLGAGPATGSDQPIDPFGSFVFNVSGATQFSCVTSSGSQVVNAVAGTGFSNATAGFPSVQPISGTVSLTGTLPAFAATPTVNVGTMPSVVVASGVISLSGTLPGFASTPSVNVATLPTPLNAAPTFVRPSSVTPNGYCQMSVSSTATLVSAGCSGGIPTGSIYALICNESAAARWRDDGVSPTASVGQIIATGTATGPVCAAFSTTLSAVQFITETSGSLLNISFYK